MTTPRIALQDNGRRSKMGRAGMTLLSVLRDLWARNIAFDGQLFGLAAFNSRGSMCFSFLWIDSSHTDVPESCIFHLRRIVNVPEIDHERCVHNSFGAFKLQRPELVPFR
jgi:hypothetical protein